MLNKLLVAAALALMPLSATLAQTAVTLPIAANAVADIGNGPIKVRMIAGNASIFTSQGSGVGSTSGSSTALTLTGTPATAPIVGGLISGTGITSGTTISAYNGTTGITLSAAMTVAGGTAVAWGAACPSTPPSNVIQASAMAGYYIMYTQARVCAVSPGGPVNTLLIGPIFYDQTSLNSGGGSPPCVNPVLYGVDPTFAVDSAPGLNAALAASSCVVFPPGHYKFLSQISYAIPTGNHSVTIAGSGQDNTLLDWPNNTNGIVISYGNGQSTAHVRDLTIETGSASANTGLVLRNLTLNTFGALSPPSDVQNVTFRGNDGGGATNAWVNGLALNNVSDITLFNDTFIGTSGNLGQGLSFGGNSGLSSQAVVLNVISCLFTDLSVGINYGVAAQGLTVANSNFTSGTNGIFVSGALSPLTQLSVTGSQFATANDINLGSLVSSLHVVGNLFIQAASQNALTLASTQGAYIVGNNFAGGGASSNFGITIAATVANSTTEIIGNSFHNLAAGINLSGASSAAVIANNDFFSNTNAILNSSTGVLNRIHDNVGYNPVGVTASANVCASPCTITAGPSPETHYLRQSATNTATVTKGGQAVATLAGATTYYPFDLGPNESLVVTWTTTNPTDTKDVH